MLVVAERLDASADMVVDQLNQRDVPVMRYDSADFPRRIVLSATHSASEPGWSGILDDGRRSVRLQDVRAVYYRRPGRPLIAEAVSEPYATWARDQADAALLNVMSALAVRWINNPHTDRIASHKPQQLVSAVRAGLRAPRSIITNDPAQARRFAQEVGGPVIMKPILGGRLDTGEGRKLMVATHTLDPAAIDDSLRLTAHYLQEQIPKAYEVRLTVVDGRLFPARLDVSTDQGRTDWRTEPGTPSVSETDVPDAVADAVRRYMASYGLVFGALDFAVTPTGEWVFFECNPAGTWAWAENAAGLGIASAHADYLTEGTTGT